MRMAGKLAAALSGVLLLILSSALLLSYRTVRGHLEAAQDSRLQEHWRRLAEQCGAAWGPGFERICLDSLYHTIGLSEPDAFSSAYLLDGSRRTLIHSDFLRGNYSKRGALVDDADIRLEADQSAPFLLRHPEERIFGFPLFLNNRRIGTVVAVYREAELRRALAWIDAEARRGLGLACLLGAIVSVLVSAGLAYYFLSPIDAVAKAAGRVGSGDFHCKVPEDRNDEMGQLAADFNRMIDRLSELDELKDSFTAKITHDLKSPMAAIQTVLGNLLGGYKGPLAPQQAEDLKLVIGHGKALGDLIDHVLEVTRLEAGRAGFEKEKIDVESEISSVFSLMVPRAQEFGVNLSSQVSPEVTEVFADAAAFRRVLINLISNALKFTPKGGSIVVKALRSEKGIVRFAVADTGIGIPKERIGSLFKKFSQVPETRNKVREAGGSGLGLLICKEIVEGHGGRIWAESELFRGTTIYFTVPEGASAA